jgi:hypothetical protein
MTEGMISRNALVCLTLGALPALGCPSKEGERQDAQAAQAKSATPPSAGPVGPLSNLETLPATTETWAIDGQPTAFVYYAEHDLRVSASCRQPNGQVACDAVRFMRNGSPVEIARRFLDGRQSPGVKVCMRLNQPVLVARSPEGSEDSYCRFPDGSLASTGALERFSMRVIE